MAKPINLANVNITIQQFQQIASGKFNAGEVKLKSEHSLDIINNHVRSRDENVKTISHDEVLAIKQAFVRALSQNGVGPDALNDIRRRIGLAPDPSLPVALRKRSTTWRATGRSAPTPRSTRATATRPSRATSRRAARRTRSSCAAATSTPTAASSTSSA